MKINEKMKVFENLKTDIGFDIECMGFLVNENEKSIFQTIKNRK